MTITLLGLLDDEQIILDTAALALSQLDHPGLDIGHYERLLQEIGDRVASLGAEAETPGDQAAILAAILHDEFGFKGDVATYDAPLNGDLIRVLDRRQGLPVSLSILYVSAARRVGWVADPLNTPGHVLVRVGRDDAIIIDPFNGGAIVHHDQLVALLGRAAAAGVEVSPERSGPMSNRSTLVRLLMNQATRAEEAKDAGRAMTIYQRMAVIAPDHPDGLWSLARLQLDAGFIDEARRSLSAMLETTRDEERRAQVMSVLERISTH